MASIESKSQYINLKTGETVEVVKQDGHRTEVVTVTTTGARISPRSVPTSSLKHTPYNNRGDFLTTGLVAISELPSNHPLVPKSSSVESVEASSLDPSTMDDEELSAHAHKCKDRMELSKSVYETARDELASRTSGNGGLRIHGNVAVEATRTRRISDALARRVLSEKDLAMVSVPKVQSGLVKKLLGEETYETVCENHGWTIKVREATSEDHQRLAS